MGDQIKWKNIFQFSLYFSMNFKAKLSKEPDQNYTGHGYPKF